MQTKHFKKINILLLFGSLALSFVAIEVMLAIFYPQKIIAKPFFHIQSFFCQYDQNLGWVNKPDYRGAVRVASDFSFFVTQNSKGLRDREHPHTRIAGKRRIAVLGDSFVWGFGVKDSEVFSEVIEATAPKLEVINMGVSGYDTGQEYLTYINEGHKYQPDLLVLAFYMNDLNELGCSINYGYPKPYVPTGRQPLSFSNIPVPKTEETERKLYGNPSSLFGNVKKILRRNTHIYPFIVGRLNSIAWMRQLFLLTGLGDDYSRQLKGIPYSEINDDKEIDDILRLIVLELQRVSRKQGVEFLLVNIPIREGDKTAAYNGFNEGTAKQNNLISEGLGRLCKKESIHFLDLLPVIRSEQARGIRCYSSYDKDIHLNREGHRLFAESIINWVRGWEKEDKKMTIPH